MKNSICAITLVSLAGGFVACSGNPSSDGAASAEASTSTDEALTFSTRAPKLTPSPAPTSTWTGGSFPLPPTAACGGDGESCCASKYFDASGLPHPLNVCNPGYDCQANNHCVKQPPPPPCGKVGEACCSTGVDCRATSSDQQVTCRSDSYGAAAKCVDCGHLWQPACIYSATNPREGCTQGIHDQFNYCIPEAINLPTPPAHDVPTAKSGFDARARAFLEHEACNNNDLRYPGNPDPDAEHWGTTALAMAAFDGKCRINHVDETWSDRMAIIDRALANFDDQGRGLGSTLKPIGRKGELDALLKDLVPLLYLYGSRLTPETYDKILNRFGQIDSGPYTDGFNSFHFDNTFEMSVLESIIPIPGLVLLDNVIEVEVPETENHLLLIHSARYLINQLLRRRAAADPVATSIGEIFGHSVDNRQNGMRDYLLKEMQRILQHDFQEYNSRPYNRYSLDAVENLAEFAEDPEVATAARAVLDFQAAKYAISSSFSRRSAPFRRRRDLDSPQLIGDSMDEEACRFALYAGTTDLMQNSSDAWFPVTVPQACHLVARQAAGSYRVPELILQMALEPQVRPTFQTFAGGTNPFHDAPGGVELTANDKHFMISGGGIPLASGLGVTVHLRIGSNPFIPTEDGGDLGIAVPTLLIPTQTYGDDPRNGFNRDEMVHLGGDYMVNTCVAPGFACGFKPVVPDKLCNDDRVAHRSTCWEGNWAFLDFAGFYATVWHDKTNGAGFFEAVEASHFKTFDEFRNKVRQTNGDNVGQLSGNVFDVNYVNSLGKRIVAHLDANAPRTYPIRSYDGQRLPTADVDSWPLAKDYDGWSSVASRGHDGVVTVGAAGVGECTLDLSDAQHPQRIGRCD